MITERWILPAYYQLGPTVTQSRQLDQLCVELTTDGYSTTYTLTHWMGISATDLLLGYPLVEIVDPATFPVTPSTGATHTTLTGKQALLGVTVSSSLTDTLILAFSNPAAPGAQSGECTFQILLTRNPASVNPIPTQP